MTRTRRIGVLAAALAMSGAVVITGVGTAQAEWSGAIWARYHEGAWADQATCDQYSTWAEDPPWLYTWPCTYFNGDPDGRNRGSGWYYYVMADVS
ncbi:MAG: hypothetical protein M3443_05655 [Actinomycetota bacterium]|nr:hypothetical protein [Actinomycetota bacterium]